MDIPLLPMPNAEATSGWKIGYVGMSYHPPWFALLEHLKSIVTKASTFDIFDYPDRLDRLRSRMSYKIPTAHTVRTSWDFRLCGLAQTLSGTVKRKQMSVGPYEKARARAGLRLHSLICRSLALVHVIGFSCLYCTLNHSIRHFSTNPCTERCLSLLRAGRGWKGFKKGI